MSEKIPSNCRYTRTHEWVRLEKDGKVTVGITDYAAHALGDVVFVELPEVASGVEAGGEAGVIESVKAASDWYHPLKGTVVETNSDLANNPGLINTLPYEAGWLYRLKPSDVRDVEKLLDAKDYASMLATETAS